MLSHKSTQSVSLAAAFLTEWPKAKYKAALKWPFFSNSTMSYNLYSPNLYHDQTLDFELPNILKTTNTAVCQVPILPIKNR